MFLTESNNNVIKYKVEKYETVDTCTLGMLRENRIEGIITLGTTKDNGEEIFLFAVSKLLPLHEVLKNSEHAYEALYSLAEQLNELQKRMDDYFIPRSELILSCDLSFAEVLEAGSFKLMLLCMPTSNAYSFSKGVRELLLSSFAVVNYPEEEKPRALEFMQFILSEEFSLEALMSKLSELKDQVVDINTYTETKKKNKVSIFQKIKGAFAAQSSDFEDEIFDFEEDTSHRNKKLCVLAVRSSGDEYPIFRSELIGTDPAMCSICFDENTHPLIRKEHCKVTMVGDKCFVENLVPAGDVSVNGKPLEAKERMELKSADVIRVGNEELIFSYR